MWKDLPHDKFPKVSVNTISNYFQPVTQNDDQHLRRFEDVQLNLENSLFIKDTNETWVELNVCKQKDVVNLIVGLISKYRNEEFGETYYNCHIEWDIVYSKEPFILLSQKTMEFHRKCINNCVMIEKRLLKMNKSDGLCKLCECDFEDLMHVLCNCETIKEFWKFVIDLINVNINNNWYKYVEKDVMLGCLNANLEADTRSNIFLHLAHAAYQGHENVFYEQ